MYRDSLYRLQRRLCSRLCSTCVIYVAIPSLSSSFKKISIIAYMYVVYVVKSTLSSHYRSLIRISQICRALFLCFFLRILFAFLILFLFAFADDAVVVIVIVVVCLAVCQITFCMICSCSYKSSFGSNFRLSCFLFFFCNFFFLLMLTCIVEHATRVCYSSFYFCGFQSQQIVVVAFSRLCICETYNTRQKLIHIRLNMD